MNENFKTKAILIGMLAVTLGGAVWMHYQSNSDSQDGCIERVSYSNDQMSLRKPVSDIPGEKRNLSKTSTARTGAVDDSGRVPIEIIEKNQKPVMVYVQPTSTTAVPEPGVFPLTILTFLLFLRRRR